MSQLFRSERFHYTFGPHAPTLHVKPGATLAVVCPDSDNAFADGSLIPEARKQRADGSALFEGNPMAGPIYVEGARPGHCLAVTITEVELDRDYGQTLLAPGHGLLPSHMLYQPYDPHPGELAPRHMYRWNIDREKGVARLANPLGKQSLSVKLRPFVGCIGVCPPWGQHISTLYGGDFGGNVDLPSFAPGSTLLLPIFTDGALLMMGDIHAAQGHGEIIGGGIETSGRIHCRIDLIEDFHLPGPRVITGDNRLLCVVTEGDMRTAVQRAYGRLVQWLVESFAIYRWDAYNLISQVAFIELGGIGDHGCDVAAGIRIDDLPRRCQRVVERGENGVRFNQASLNDYIGVDE